MIKGMLHVEGMAILFLSVFFYAFFDFSWILFVVLILAPDLSMLGYIFNNKLGAFTYNAFHTYTVPIFISFIGFFFSSSLTLEIGIIWMAHIGLDRMVGYGLKYQTNFKDSHLQRVKEKS